MLEFYSMYNERESYMREAILEARKAGAAGDVPIGAVIVKGGAIIARGFNMIEAEGDPTAHAEMIAIREAAKTLGNMRLIDCEMYVTTEPCAMCAGACVLARLDAVYAGTESPKSGAAGSVNDILCSPSLNHRVRYEVGILKEECSALLSDFFRELREK
ncbi:MAG: tRNA adenosine(34) deaminase TadA [Clostridiales Family XIII bacterium]|jgi:tRNA(adenine34) deaminase|nr:tRNA adenosine(34) deaminase TadA [Clostridiales Family XIII bacterium]